MAQIIFRLEIPDAIMPEMRDAIRWHLNNPQASTAEQKAIGEEVLERRYRSILKDYRLHLVGAENQLNSIVRA